jgi:hypothetical protein
MAGHTCNPPSFEAEVYLDALVVCRDAADRAHACHASDRDAADGVAGGEEVEGVSPPCRAYVCIRKRGFETLTTGPAFPGSPAFSGGTFLISTIVRDLRLSCGRKVEPFTCSPGSRLL